jgi:hypothetical protein
MLSVGVSVCTFSLFSLTFPPVPRPIKGMKFPLDIRNLFAILAELEIRPSTTRFPLPYREKRGTKKDPAKMRLQTSTSR